MDKIILRRDLEDILSAIDVNNNMRIRLVIHIDSLEKELSDLEHHRYRLEQSKIRLQEKLVGGANQNGQ